MAHNLTTRLTLAGAMLAAGLAALSTAAHLGVVQLGAGDMNIVVGRGERGMTMEIGARTCPPRCGFDFKWRPLKL
ncbi:MAG: hypothetical protein SGJ21_11325 [Alphaproteobacteria bacterium]|nr:hypothetical protein [Alphaproteobacteria bacterium]